jgi:hypothetical protein
MAPAGEEVTAKSESGHSGVAEWSDRFTFDNGPSRHDSQIMVREGLLSRDVTGSIRPKADLKVSRKQADALTDFFPVLRLRSSRSWISAPGQKPSVSAIAQSWIRPVLPLWPAPRPGMVRHRRPAYILQPSKPET